MGDVIFMNDRSSKNDSRNVAVRDRRYHTRYPLAADVLARDLEGGAETEGVTSDVSSSGVFVCTSKPLPSNTRVRLRLTRKDQKIEALGVVRTVKPRVGMGIEFIAIEPPYSLLGVQGVLALFVEFVLDFQAGLVRFDGADRFHDRRNPALDVPLTQLFCSHRTVA